MADELTREDIAKMISLMTAAVEGIGEVAEATRKQDVAIKASDRRARRAAWVGGAVALLVLVLGGMQLSNRQVIATLEDCTRPGGACFAEAQDRQAKIVGPVAQSLGRIEERGEDNRRLLCLGIPDARRPVDLCPPE